MGIPSYYRKLGSTVAGFYSDAPPAVDWFLMDFNCLVYQVLRSMRPYVGDREAFEAELIAETLTYTRQLLAAVRPRATYIALDGVVPLAKMKQQRMRRFRSVALAAEERRLGLRSGPSWDTNALTPGTVFMDKLGAALKTLPDTTVSDVRERGEGEHKVMRWLRAHPDGQHVIYGMDGDLFVLALLNQALHAPSAKIHFFREEAEPDGGMVWLDLARLRAALIAEKRTTIDGATWIKEYAIAMCLLGNDFVPQSMAFRIKEDGHERLLEMLNRLHVAGGRLVGSEGLDEAGWQRIFSWLAAEEERRILTTIRRKKKSRPAHNRGQTATDALKARINDRPLEWFPEADGRLLAGEALKADWRAEYARIGLGAPAGTEAIYLAAAAERYIEAVVWTYDYYVGVGDNVAATCQGVGGLSSGGTPEPNASRRLASPPEDFMYEFASAPLFADVIGRHLKGPSVPQAPPATPSEQLALVLPRESYHLIPKCPERMFLVAAPEYFPEKWHYHHLGKRHFWECEAGIAVPTIRVLRDAIRRLV
jgi:5'-3' exonuclease